MSRLVESYGLLKAFEGRESGQTRRNFGAFLFFFVCILLVIRLPFGIDLTDEAYYAIFVDDWLKGSIATSTLRTFHQTAALIIYPIVKSYVALSGSSSHLMLLLRTIYLAGSVATALTWVSLTRRLGSSLAAWMGGGLVLAFIPFGLPAPSYNTLGQQGLMMALSTLGLARLSAANVNMLLLCSAASWAMATVAYPSMIVPLAACLILLAFADGWTRHLRIYMMSILGSEVVAWSSVIAALSVDHLIGSIRYLASINDVGGWGRKLDFSLGLIERNPVFVSASVAAFLVGLARTRLGATRTALLLTLAVGGLFLGPPALFCRSHDIISVLALSGVSLAARLGRNNLPEDRVLAMVWVVSMVAGLTTMATAFNSLFNFAIGALPAATASLAGLKIAANPGKHDAAGWGGLTVHAIGLASMLSVSLSFLYGNLPDHPWPSVRVEEGAYAGLVGQPEQVAALGWMRDVVSPLTADDHRIAFFGWPYGLILATSARPLGLAVFPLDETMNPRGLATTQAFFEEPSHRPSLVVIDRGPYTRPFNPMGTAFDRWYEPIGTTQQALSSFSLYRRR